MVSMISAALQSALADSRRGVDRAAPVTARHGKSRVFYLLPGVGRSEFLRGPRYLLFLFRRKEMAFYCVCDLRRLLPHNDPGAEPNSFPTRISAISDTLRSASWSRI